jgi:hypothetical protein
MQIAISGASGFLGRFLTQRLESAGHSVRPLARVGSSPPEGPAIPWDPAGGVLDPAAIAGMDAIVHLAGEPIGHRWTSERKRRIRESRVRGTETIARAMAATRNRSMTLISMSGINIYGDRGDEVLDEQSGTGNDFLARVASEWERATDPARDAGVRVVLLRTSLVLAAAEGGLAKMLPIFRAGLGGPLGSGAQWLSWIALEDYARCVLFLLGAAGAAGPINVTAPHPVRNGEFSRVLGGVLHRPAVLPVPAVALRLAFGEMAEATVLASQRALPRRLGELGFQFRFPLVSDALAFELQRDG